MTDKILRIKQVVERIGLSRTTVWRMVKRGQFPPPIALYGRNIGWRDATVTSWILERERDSRNHDHLTNSFATLPLPQS